MSIILELNYEKLTMDAVTLYASLNATQLYIINIYWSIFEDFPGIKQYYAA